MRPLVRIDDWFVGYAAYNGVSEYQAYTVHEGVVLPARDIGICRYDERDAVVVDRPVFYRDHTKASLAAYRLSMRLSPEWYQPKELHGQKRVVYQAFKKSGLELPPNLDQVLLSELYPCMCSDSWQINQFLHWKEGMPPPQLLPKYASHVQAVRDSYVQLVRANGQSPLLGLAARLQAKLALIGLCTLSKVLPETSARIGAIVEDAALSFSRVQVAKSFTDKAFLAGRRIA